MMARILTPGGRAERFVRGDFGLGRSFFIVLFSLTGEEPDHSPRRAPQKRSRGQSANQGAAPTPAFGERAQGEGGTHQHAADLQPRNPRSPDDMPATAGHAEKIPAPIQGI